MDASESNMGYNKDIWHAWDRLVADMFFRLNYSHPQAHLNAEVLKNRTNKSE